MKRKLPATTQKEMDQFVNAILKAEWAVEEDRRNRRIAQALIKKHGRSKAKRIWDRRIKDMQNAVRMMDAEVVARWELRRKTGQPLPLDPPAL